MAAREPADQPAREQALDPGHSFIVQAPAGSGKTELLTQRYLQLLCAVDEPEEVVAITFTRKAAAEMRNRILDALDATDLPVPDSAHGQRTRTLAQGVRQRDGIRGWNLRAHPARLRIHTIDGLCSGLTRQMPWLTRFGAPPAIAEPCAPLYRDAARATLRLVETGAQWSDAIAQLLLHLDNDFPKAEGLLVDMLARRDQWRRHLRRDLAPEALRDALEGALADTVTAALTALCGRLSGPSGTDLARLAGYAGEILRAAGRNSPIRACAGISALPSADPGGVEQWRGIAGLLLTAEGHWRKKLTATVGVPASRNGSGAEMSALGHALLEQWAADDALRAQLHAVRGLPPTRYTEAQWALLQALFELLRVAVAQLRLVFQERGQADYVEITQAAVDALGDEESPTELALVLDYRIRHLLVDEFQDTSYSQYELLRRLTAGWEPGDGRTLFLVGDPMQSIYRFREADVALYLHTRRRGIGGIVPETLTLSVNFRSRAGVVEWVNRHFPVVFPPCEDPDTGAVTYVAATPWHDADPAPAVHLHPLPPGRADAEAQQVVHLIRDAQTQDPGGRTAILVRARTHLGAILPALRAAGLRYQALDIEPLAGRPVVQDLLALTRALLHPADRVAWLAVLRAPWCGLCLADLHALAGGDRVRTLRELCDDPQRMANLSDDGRARLARVRAVLEAARAQRQRRALRTWVEGVWLALGGPACGDATALADARVFLGLLETLDEGGDLADLDTLEERVGQLYAQPDVEAPDTLQIMSLHKAKGLEFDTVIVPGLDRRPPADSARLLRWIETGTADGHADVLLAPIAPAGNEEDPIYRYVKSVDGARARHEAGRLLYVAATRARRRLHLLGRARMKSTDAGPQLLAPQAGSLLSLLWPVVEGRFRETLAAETVSAPVPDTAPAVAVPRALRRVPAGWRTPSPPDDVAWTPPRASTPPSVTDLEFQWVRDTTRHAGTVVHRALRRIAQEGVAAWDAARVQDCRGTWRAALIRLGVAPDALEAALERVTRALHGVLEDPRAHWILSGDHTEAHSEYALTGTRDGVIRRVVIDRTFVDQDGTRWIIDFKTGGHEGAGVETFLDREQTRYRPQLEGYGALLRSAESRPVRLGLYFPLLQGWREWEAGKP
ncbi:MAG: hypothetical protein B7Z66_12875 [Chromatiales bacterium 21-64-14]|nr:MAG: hypothetical protein B7Z66_12875 [Chromatiales bacterium 21-64-14]HQU16354.1 UvrD-helicase domain-containing protein [Gammaproteobacteria bacterium]